MQSVYHLYVSLFLTLPPYKMGPGSIIYNWKTGINELGIVFMSGYFAQKKKLEAGKADSDHTASLSYSS